MLKVVELILNLVKLIALCVLLFFGGKLVISLLSSNSKEATSSQAESPNEAANPKPVVEPSTIDMDGYYQALLLRKDKSGKTDLMYLAQLGAGERVKFNNAYFYALAPSGEWEVKFTSSEDGSFVEGTSHNSLVICTLSDQEQRSYWSKNDKKRSMVITGTVEYTDNGKVFLRDCEFQDI